MSDQEQTTSSNNAASMIRQKVSGLYDDEPNTKEELGEVAIAGAHSKHQHFVQQLAKSGKNYAEMQQAWHEYYQSLPDHEKHAVWQEFYDNQSRTSHLTRGTGGAVHTPQRTPHHPEPDQPHHQAMGQPQAIIGGVSEAQDAPKQTVAELKTKIKARVSADGRLTKKDHIKAVLFALGSGVLSVAIFGFVLFNQLFLTPFITPSVNASSSPLISDNGAVSADPRIIIPKINVDAPLVLGTSSNDEKVIQQSLEKGVTLYPNTGLPGELANPTMFGHSSNNIFNKGNYKFVFVLLNKLEVGDTFYINYNSKRYVYKVFERQIVKPNDVDVLSQRPKPAMATLITCDPPGTSNNRLIVWGEQISPDPTANVASATKNLEAPKVIPSNPESLWSRIWHSVF